MDEIKRELKLGLEVGVLIVNVSDYASVEAAVAQTRVVINTVGPYWKYADHVVRCERVSLTLRVDVYTPAEPAQAVESTTSTLPENPISSKL